MKAQKLMTIGVTTKNPRVCAHISPEMSDVIEAYMRDNVLNQSEAVRDALDIFYGLANEDRELLKAIANQQRRSIGNQGAILLGEAIQEIRRSLED